MKRTEARNALLLHKNVEVISVLEVIEKAKTCVTATLKVISFIENNYDGSV